MQEELFIRMGSNVRDPCYWCLYSHLSSSVVASGSLDSSSDLSSLKQYCVGSNAVIFLSGSSVSSFNVDLPAKNQSKVIKAIPEMNEDLFLEQTQDLHFANSPVLSNNSIDTFLVNKNYINIYVEILKAAKIKFKYIAPDYIALPVNEDCYSILEIDSDVLLRRGSSTLYCFHKNNLGLFLKLLLKESDGDLKIAPLSYISGLEDLQKDIKFTIIDDLMTEDIPIVSLIKGFDSSYVNFATGPYKLSNNYLKHFHLVKDTSVYASVFFFVWIFYLFLSTKFNDKNIMNVHKEILSTYNKIKPDDRANSRDINSKINKLLKNQSDNKSNDFFSFISLVHDIFSKSYGMKLLHLSYSKKKGILMTVQAENYDNLKNFKSSGEKQSLIVSLGKIDTADKSLVCKITIKAKK